MMRIHQAQLATALLVSLAFSSCSSWQVSPVRPQQLLASDPPETIQVRDTAGGLYLLDHPRLVGDSVTGIVTVLSIDEGSGLPVSRRAERRIPLAGVDRIGVTKVDAGKTGGLLALLGAFGLFLAHLARGLVAAAYH